MVEVKATQDQWQWVMWYLGSAQMPQKLGEKTYNAAMRARVQDELSAVFDALLPHSYYMQQHGAAYQPLFGAKDDWIVKDPTPGAPLQQTCADKIYSVELPLKAVSGLLWLFAILLTPSVKLDGPEGLGGKETHQSVLPSLASRFIWPIARAIGKEVQLKRAVGIVDEVTNWDEVAR